MKMRIGALRLTTEPDNQQAFKELEAKFAAIQRAQAVIEFDMDGHILSANDNFLAAMGYQLSEIAGQHHRLFVTDEVSCSNEYAHFWQSLKRGEFKSGEFLRRNKLGQDVWIQATYNPIFDANGKPYKVVKFASDITAQKIKTADVESQIDAISKSQAVIHFNLDGTILWANDNFLGAMGYQLAEVKGQHHRIFVPQDYGQSAQYQQFWQKLQRGEYHAGEFQRVNKQGEDVWIQASYNPIFDTAGKPIKVVKYASDITAQKIKSADSQGKINAISKSQAVIEFNMDGTIITANDNYLGAIGYSLAEIQGQHHRMFVPADYGQSDEYQAFWAKLNRGEFETAQYKRIAKGGREIWIQASYNPIFDLHGKPVKVVKFASDITAQKLQNTDYEGQIAAIGKSQAVIEFKPDGTILTANDNFLAAVGYTLAEIQGQHHRLFVAPEEKHSPEYAAFWETLNRGEYQTAEYRRIGKGGKEIWIQASYNPILDDEGRVLKVVKYATDITANKMQNADFEGQIAAIGKSQAVIQFNMDGSIIDANENFLNAMGYSIDDIKGQKHRLFMPADAADSADYRTFWDKLREGEYQSGEFKRVDKNGNEIWIQASYNPIFDISGKPFKVVKYASDITAQKQQSADFEGQIAAIGKSQAVIEFDLDGNILTANDNFLNAMGYSLNEITGHHHSLFVATVYKASPEYRQFWHELKSGKFQAGEFKRINKSGDEVWISASYNPIFDPNGKPYKVVKYATDVTGRVQAVNAVRHTLEALSAGDLNSAINDDFIPEFEDLKLAINGTIARLRDIVMEINNSAVEVTSGAQEIQQGNSDLSDRTEQQASSLQQTAASMEEMTSTVQENAANSREANALSEEARQKAERGGTVVSAAVTSMQEISASSNRIADIIGVIDEIAFQTNLLALNAAVEAARAGEDGRGFAVVATEVRSLAQRSAGAAKEIKGLIEDSVSKVEDGTKLVNQSGETLNDIVSAVNSVSSMVEKITESTNEQSSGIAEINNAMAHMDGMTQQNAALVEEASAASKSLSMQADDMIDQLNFFRLH